MSIYLFRAQKLAQKSTTKKIENDRKIVSEWNWVSLHGTKPLFKDDVLLANGLLSCKANQIFGFKQHLWSFSNS